MTLVETNHETLGNFPFDPFAVFGNKNLHSQWLPISNFMAFSRAGDEGNRALVSSTCPVGTKSTRRNWPPSIKREEATVLKDLKKRVGHFRVKNTSIFKTITVSDEKNEVDEAVFKKGDNLFLNKSNEINHPDNLSVLLKMLSTRPLNKICSSSDTQTDWFGSDFITECLCWHNVYRQRHRSPPLTLSSELCSYAQDWANTLAHKDIFYYKPKESNVGQNIYCKLNAKEPGNVTGQEVAGHWYSKFCHYDFLKETEVLHTNVNAGPFAQLVWASSTQIGLGIACSRSGKVMVVAHYRPPGNINGQFQKNVFLPILEHQDRD